MSEAIGINKGLSELKLVLIKFGVNFTEDELRAIYFTPHSKLAIKTKQYVYQCIKEAAKRYFKEELKQECNN